MSNIPSGKEEQGREAHIQETGDPAVWELEWEGVPTLGQARRIIKWAEKSILPRGGETLVLTCGEGQEGMLSELERWPESMVSRNSERCEIKFVEQDNEGFIHDDRDCRTPLTRINCTTCINQIIHTRTRKREESLGRTKVPERWPSTAGGLPRDTPAWQRPRRSWAKRWGQTPQPEGNGPDQSGPECPRRKTLTANEALMRNFPSIEGRMIRNTPRTPGTHQGEREL